MAVWRRCARCTCGRRSRADDSYYHDVDRPHHRSAGYPTMSATAAAILSTTVLLVLADVTGVTRLAPDDSLLITWVFAAVLVTAGVYLTTTARAIDVMLNGSSPANPGHPENAVPWRFICGMLDSVIAVVFATALCSTAIVVASPGNQQIRCGLHCSPRVMPADALFPIVHTWGVLLLHSVVATVHSSTGGILIVGTAAVCLFAAHALVVFIAYITFLMTVMIRISISTNARDSNEMAAIRQADEFEL
jgi:hypothetical protein